MVSWFGIDQCRPGFVRKLRRNLDLLAKRRMQQFGGLDDQRVDVDLDRLQRLPARKCQQVLGELRAALGGIVDQLGDRGEFGLIGHRLGQNADGAGDDRQDVVEVVGDAAGELADRVHLLGLPELGFGGALLGDIAADEEMPPHRLGPAPHPVQRHDVLSIPVRIPRLETAHLQPAPRRAHFLPRALEIVGMDEVDRAAPDHLFGPVTQDVRHAGADLDEISDAVGHQDQVLRRFEDALPLLGLAVQRRLGSLALGDVAGDLRGADDVACGGADRRDGERHVDALAVLVHTHRLEILDPFAAADLPENPVGFLAPMRRNDQGNMLADGFSRGISEQALGGRDSRP